MANLIIIFNDDGSVYKLVLPKYVNQGSDGVDYLYVGFKDNSTPIPTTHIAHFKLPNGEHNDLILSTNNGNYYRVDVQGTTYLCYGAALTSDQTMYDGILEVSVEFFLQGGTILYTYQTKITVNPTTYVPDSEDVNINHAEYEQIAQMLGYMMRDTASQDFVLTAITRAQLQPGISLSDNVEAASSNAVKSSGIYTFVMGEITKLTNGTTVVAKAQVAEETSFTTNLVDTGDGFTIATIPDDTVDPMDYDPTWGVSGTNDADKGPIVNGMDKGKNYLVLIQYKDEQGTECMASCGVMHMFPSQLIESPMFKDRGGRSYYKVQFSPSSLVEESYVRCSIWIGFFDDAGNDFGETRPAYTSERHRPQIFFREIK